MNRLPAGVLVLALLSGPSLAQPVKPGFDSIDINGDGVITLAEFGTVFPSHGPRLFSIIDRNRDGEITIDEYALLTPPIEVAER